MVKFNAIISQSNESHSSRGPARGLIRTFIGRFRRDVTIAMSAVAVAIAALASNGTISFVIPLTRVNSTTQQYRWEPSSTDTGGWVTSWHELGTTRNGTLDPSIVRAYTSVWNGSSWSSAVLHSAAGNPMLDQFLGWDASRSRYSLTALDYNVVWNSVYLSWSSDGNAWTGPILCGTIGTQSTPATGLAADMYRNVSYDFPSVAVNSSGTNGRIVVGATMLVGGSASWATAYSDDSGNTWSGPYTVAASTNGPGRLVWSSSGFHVFIVNMSGGANWTLEHYTSPDSITWTKIADVATNYPAPLESATISGLGGDLSFSVASDATASAGGLGWVVMFPVTANGRNAINVTTENGDDVNINYTTDLFSAGITTSASGDWYLGYQTFQGGDRVLPVEDGVVYRTPGSPPSYLGAILQQNIDVTQWWYFTDINGAPHRCVNNPCYTSGDFFRPTMNQYTSAAIPFIQQPLDPVNYPDLNDVVQAFVQDPPSSNLRQFVPNIVPISQGDMSWLSAITPEMLQQAARDRSHPWISPMIAEELRRFGRLP